MVSSRRSIFFSGSVISTMSGHAEVTKIRSGMVETGFSQAREPGRSAMRDTSGGRCAMIADSAIIAGPLNSPTFISGYKLQTRDKDHRIAKAFQ